MRTGLTLNNNPEVRRTTEGLSYDPALHEPSDDGDAARGHTSVQRHMPGVPMTANFAYERWRVNGSRCVDRFEIFGSVP